MGKPTLTYFNCRSRGELIRFVAALGNVDYVDNRFIYAEWPGDLKSKTPYGQLPTLEVDGQVYAQKIAIALYFARKGGLYPTSASPEETLKYDDNLNFSEEILENILLARVEQLFQKKTDKLTVLKNEQLPQKVPLLEKLLKENGTGYFVGDKLSIVDASVFDVTEHIVDIQGKAYLDSFPLLKAHFERLSANENLKKYVSSRPGNPDVNF